MGERCDAHTPSRPSFSRTPLCVRDRPAVDIRRAALRVQSLQLARPAILALVALRVLCGGGVVSMALKSACCLMFPRVCFLTFVLSLCPRVVSMALTVVVLSHVAAHVSAVSCSSALSATSSIIGLGNQ